MNRNALDMVEESIDLLRQQSALVWLQYLLGAVPFLLALLAFEYDMTVGYNASRCTGESLLCAMLFLWLNVCKARFSGSLLSALAGGEADSERSGVAQCCLLQTAIQTTKLLVLPLAAVAIAPFPWTSAFYRDAAIEADRARNTLPGILRKASRHASSAARENWIGLLLLVLIGFIVLINILLLLLLLPELIRALIGSESDWTRNAAHALNWQTLLEAVTLTWFVLDPVLQSFAVVRHFYAEARKDGRDLLANLRRITAGASLVLIASLAVVRLPGAEPSKATPRLSIPELDRGVNEALKADEYRWRFVQNRVQESFLQRSVHQLNEGMSAVWKRVRQWMRKLFHQDETDKTLPERPVKPDRSLPWMVGGLAGVIALALVMVVIRNQWRKPATSPAPVEAAPKADLSDENLLASEAREEEWLRLAKEYTKAGELRWAVRAMYLANLAALGQRQLIVPARWKSNRLYERELRLRSRADALCDAFASSNRDYERVWFGFHDVSHEQIANFEERLQIIRTYGA